MPGLFSAQAPVVNADLASAGDRWPRFAPKAIAAGFQSVHAFPMRLRGATIGALNLFGRADVEFEDSDVHVVQALADGATIALLQERSIARSEALTEQLQSALNSRIVIEQAKGALAQTEGVTLAKPSPTFKPPGLAAAAVASASRDRVPADRKSRRAGDWPTDGFLSRPHCSPEPGPPMVTLRRWSPLPRAFQETSAWPTRTPPGGHA